MSQTVNTTRTDYLLDLQAGLPKVLAATTGTNTERYIHAIRGLHATESPTGTWTYALEDALGSVRGTIGSTHQFQSTHNYDPYGHPDTTITGFAFTGEPRDANGLQYHRARYYNPSLAGWLSLDPYEGTIGRPMSLNGYSYVEGNTPNRTDPSGKCWDNPGTPSNQQSQCLEAWVNYASGIDLNDPTYRELLRQEDAYWRGLPYQDFTRLWNDNRARPPLSMKTRSNNAGNIMSSAVGVAGTVSFVNPFPGPEDAVAGGILAVGACLAAGAALVGALAGGGSIALPLRQPFEFSLPRDETDDDAIPIPRDIPRRETDEVILIWRGVSGNKKKGYWKNPSLKARDFRPRPGVDDDGLSLFEFLNLPPNQVTPYAYPFTVSIIGEKVAGSFGNLTEVPACMATYTPQYGLGHWSVNCSGAMDELLSTYAQSNRERTSLYPMFIGEFADDRRFDW